MAPLPIASETTRMMTFFNIQNLSCDDIESVGFSRNPQDMGALGPIPLPIRIPKDMREYYGVHGS